MPTYGYTCQECQHTLDAFQSIAEEPLKQCPQCGKPALRRDVGGASALFRLKSSSSSCCPCGKPGPCSSS